MLLLLEVAAVVVLDHREIDMVALAVVLVDY
jgi:hypothetical protein